MREFLSGTAILILGSIGTLLAVGTGLTLLIAALLAVGTLLVGALLAGLITLFLSLSIAGGTLLAIGAGLIGTLLVRALLVGALLIALLDVGAGLIGTLLAIGVGLAIGVLLPVTYFFIMTFSAFRFSCGGSDTSDAWALGFLFFFHNRKMM